MPRFRIQSNLHLDGFQMLDACLENVTSFEGLSDKNTGRIVFLNGSSSNKSNLHPAVFYDNEFKGLAYLDDIDKITNGEGSLGTRVKVLEDMLNVDSAETVVSTWEEIQAFLDNVKEGTDLMTMLDGKLDKTGGTITGQLTVDQRLIMKSLVQFNQYGGTNEYLLGMTDKNGILRWYNGSSWNTLLHAGNVGEYKAGDSAKLDGLSVTSFVRSYADVGANSKTGNWLGYTYTTKEHGGARTGGVISFGSTAYGAQINGGLDGGGLFYRGYSPSGFTDWKTIAFTDLVLLLDGSNTMTGNLKMTEGKAILWGSANLLQYTTSKFIIGRSASIDERTTEIHGYPIIFRYGNDEGTAMAITKEGNVGIGTPYTTSSLTVRQKTNGAIALGSSDNLVATFEDIYGGYGFMFNVQGSGVGTIQVGDTRNTSNSAYALNLNPLGGAVNVGGNLAPNANNSLSLGTSSYRWSDVYSVLGDFNGAVTIHSNADGAELLRFSTDRPWKFSQVGTGSATALYLSPDATSKVFAITEPDNSNVFVFGVNGNYSYATFNSSLAVANLASFNGGALIPTGQTLTIGSVTIKEVATGEIEVDGNLHTTGTLASGGKAAVGEGDTGGGGNANVYSDVLEGVITQEWEVGNPFQKEDVIVSLYMWNTDESRWEMVLADIGVTSENIWVTFGRPTSTSDKYMAVVMG